MDPKEAATSGRSQGILAAEVSGREDFSLLGQNRRMSIFRSSASPRFYAVGSSFVLRAELTGATRPSEAILVTASGQ
jgi:hypothetical protein